jgi:ABC-2 type transport system ATP-binding protein
MQQKVQFIASVIHDPDLLILDEPFSGLDPVNRRLLRELITEQNEAGRTIVFSTHAMYEAEQLCDHLFMINHGVKVLDLPMREVWRKYDPRSVAFEMFDEPDEAMRGAWTAWPDVREVLVDGNAVEFKMKDGADPGPIMNSVMQSQRVRKMEIKRPSLEDVFIELVGGSVEELRAQKPESPARPYVIPGSVLD